MMILYVSLVLIWERGWGCKTEDDRTGLYAPMTHHRLEVLADALDHLGGIAGLDVVVVVETDHERLCRLGNNNPGGALPSPQHDARLAVNDDVVLVREFCAALRVGHFARKAYGVRWVELLAHTKRTVTESDREVVMDV